MRVPSYVTEIIISSTRITSVGPEIPQQLKTRNFENTCSRPDPFVVMVQANHLWDLPHAADGCSVT